MLLTSNCSNQQRLQWRREQKRAKRSSETTEQREERLKKRREAYRKRRDDETAEKKSARIAKQRAYIDSNRLHLKQMHKKQGG